MYWNARARLTGLDPADEFRGLYINDLQVDDLLAQELGGHPWMDKNGRHPELADWPQLIAQAREHWQQRTVASVMAGQTLLLNDLARDFDLSPVELDVLLIALSAEIDLRYERLFAYLQDDVTKKRPSVDLVLKLLTDDFQGCWKHLIHFVTRGYLSWCCHISIVTLPPGTTLCLVMRKSSIWLSSIITWAFVNKSNSPFKRLSKSRLRRSGG